jgi:uncharacterized protein (TIGR02444 family)
MSDGDTRNGVKARRQERLWDYAVALYGRPGVEQACLVLQDEHGVDVPCLLFVAWLGGVCGVELDAAGAREIGSSVAHWQNEVVGPLRQARRRLREAPLPRANAEAAALRARVKAIELDAERIELAALERIGRDLPARSEPHPALAARNMRALLGGDGGALAPALHAQLEVLEGALASS